MGILLERGLRGGLRRICLARRRASVDAGIGWGCIGEADDTTWAVVQLASDESKFVTGAALVIDGGYTAR